VSLVSLCIETIKKKAEKTGR
jgi:hypothetical protein